MKKIYFFAVAMAVVLSVSRTQAQTVGTPVADSQRSASVSPLNTEPNVSENHSTTSAVDTTSIVIEQLSVSTRFADKRWSSLRLNTVGSEQISRRTTSATFPQLLSGIAGVYATAETGNYGDARINIRGFKQENISVMLNGIPISGLTSSSMYWNNWLGLTDATSSVQLQKGVGGSLFADNSVGGTINIATSTPQSNPSGSISATVTSYGLWKTAAQWNSGELKRGWAAGGNVSYVWGNNYVDATPVSVWSYMLNVSKRFNSRNSLLFTALGSPERHGQRSVRLSKTEVDQYGIRYNKGWGWRNGERFNVNMNNYFKPYFTLQHRYKGTKSDITTSAYLAVASGGGRWNEATSGSIYSYMKDGQVDFEAIESANRMATNGSQIVLSDYQAGHTQAGIMSEQTFRIAEGLTITTGEHYQYYSTWEREQLTDLLGGDYWFEQWGDNPQKQAGDYVRTRNGKQVHHATLNASIKFNRNRWSLYAGGSLINAVAQRWDTYNYTDNTRSIWVNSTGYTAKAGALHRLSRRSTLYANAASYSRVPYTGVLFSSGTNEPNHNVRNEHNTLGEVGYRLLLTRGEVELTAYYAYWRDKSILSNRYKPESGDSYKYMISGLCARHTGIELDANWQFADWVEGSLSASVADWRWLNNVKATIYDNYTDRPVETVSVYCKDIPVGDAPQNQLLLSAIFKPSRHLRATIDVDWSGRMYADFEPSSRTNADDLALPYRIPNRTIVNCTVGWRWFTVGVNNLFNTLYIERGKDGKDHTLNSFTGYWGFGRNFSFTARFDF